MRHHHGFVCKCEECLSAIADIHKYGFDPQLSFHCLKYPKCKGLIHLPLYPASSDAKVSPHILECQCCGHETDGATKILKCSDCAFEIDPVCTEDDIRKLLGMAPVKNNEKFTFFKGDMPIAISILFVRQAALMVDFERSQVVDDQKFEEAERLHELMENSILFANPHKHNWEVVRMYHNLFRVYLEPAFWFVPEKSFDLAMNRFERMIKVLPLLENFYRTGVENDNHTDYFKLVDMMNYSVSYGSTMMYLLNAHYMTPQQCIDFLEILMPMAESAINMETRVYGPNKPRRGKHQDMNEMQDNNSKFAKYYSAKYKIPMSEHLKRYLRPVEVGGLANRIEMLKRMPKS